MAFFFDVTTRRGRRRLRPALSALAAALCSLAAASAHADYIGSLTGETTEPFCPLIYGPMCKLSLSADFNVLYESNRSFDHGSPDYIRFGGEVSLVNRIGQDEGVDISLLHIGGELEVGGQGGGAGSGFHITPRALFRYWPKGGPASVEIGTGIVYEHTKPEIPGTAINNAIGFSQELSVGVLGFGSLILGTDFVFDPTGALGSEMHFMAGARLSVVTIFFIAALGAH